MGGSFQSSFSKGIECNLSFFSFSHSFIWEMLAECLACGKERKEKKYVIEASSGTMETSPTWCTEVMDKRVYRTVGNSSGERIPRKMYSGWGCILGSNIQF